jgi:DNA-binding MarR family transcriptional regulator
MFVVRNGLKGKEMPGAGAVDTARAADAALTIIRLFRSMERVEAGMTPQQYRMLKLVGAGGERSAKLAERLAVAKPTLTSTADGLVAAGLLSRETETTDRRVVRLRLTEAGRAAVNRAGAAYTEWLGELLKTAGDEDELLRDFALIDRAIDQKIAAKHSAEQPAR